MPPVMNGMARNYVTVPPPPVATGGFLAAARVIDTTEPHDLLGAEYTTDACASVIRWERDVCTPGEPPPAEGGVKSFDLDPDHVTGDPFTLYAGVECVLQRLDEAAARARTRFDYGERAAVDAAMLDALVALTTDTIPGGPMPVAEGIGLLEAWAAEQYGGVPTIVLAQGVMGCACQNGLIQRNLDGSLTTCSGSTVANVAVTGMTPNYAYATGQITILRGPQNIVSVPQQPLGDGTYEPPRALAERTYVPLIECLVVRVEVTCS